MQMLSPIGIFSGTFDPIHLGHTHLASTIQQLCSLQRILFIPCLQSPLRNQPIASAQDRFEMVKLATNSINHFFADDREIKRAGLSYTIETLKSLRKEHINTPLVLIMGNDVFNRFDEWHNWQNILDFVHLLITNRQNPWKITNKNALELLYKYQTTDIQQLQKQIAGLIYSIDIEPLPIAATKVRDLLREHKNIEHLVDHRVREYIYKKQLYT